jgi:hypothetical protein
MYQFKFVLSGTSTKNLSPAEQMAIKSLFFNRGRRVMIHTTELSASAKWYNVAGKMAIKVETDSTPLT